MTRLRYRLMTWLGGRLRRGGQWLLDEAELDPPQAEIDRIERLLRETGQRALSAPLWMHTWGCQHMTVSAPPDGPAPYCGRCSGPMRLVPINTAATATTGAHL